MRVVAYLLSLLLIAPQMLIFAAIKLLDHVTSTRSLLGFLNTALDTLDALFGWAGLAALIAVIVFIALGFSDKWRPIAAACTQARNAISAVYTAIWTAKVDVLIFLSPGLLSAALCIWLMVDRSLHSPPVRA